MVENRSALKVLRTGALVSAVTIVGLLMARAGGVTGCADRSSVEAEPRAATTIPAATTEPSADAQANVSAEPSAAGPVAATAQPSAPAAGPTAAGFPSAPPTGNGADNANSPRFFPASKSGPVFAPRDVPSPQQAAPPPPQQQKNPNQ